MRVLFVSLNRERLPDAAIPLGILSVMGSLPTRHERWLVDLCFAADPHAALRDAIAEHRPDLVAIGIRNVQSNTYDGMLGNLQAYRAAGEVIRGASSAPIVIGGAGVSVIPELLLETLQADYAIAGEGEAALRALVDAVERAGPSGPSVDHIPRLYARGPAGIQRTRGCVDFLDLDRLPRPAREHLDPAYDASSGIESVQTKRGCRLSCTYCTYPRIEGSVVRTRSPALVVDELLALQASPRPIRHVFMVDSVFNLPRNHAKAICREMIQRGFALPWTCYLNPLGFDRELADLMVAAGCAGVEIGSDSGCDHVLTALGKGFDTARIEETHRICVRAGLPDCHTFILGTEGESMDDVEQTLDFVARLEPFAAILMAWVDDEEDACSPHHAMRRAFRADIETRLDERRRREPRWIVPALAVNFSDRLFGLLRRQGLHGPLWQHIELARSPPFAHVG